MIEALKSLPDRCTILLYTDSQYLQKAMTSWISEWKKRNWQTVNKSPVKNRDLFELLDHQARRHMMQYSWVKAHAGHARNEEVDQLARYAAMNEVRKMQQPADYEADIFVCGTVNENGLGGWAFLISGANQRTMDSGSTNEETENGVLLTGVLSALRRLERNTSAKLFIESDYVLNSARSWMKRWKQNGWRKSDGSQPAHLDMWRSIDELQLDRTISWRRPNDESDYRKIKTLAASRADPRVVV